MASAPVVPVPGRHAYRGRVMLEGRHLAVVAVVLVLGLLGTGWWLLGGHADQETVPDRPVEASGLITPEAQASPPDGDVPAAPGTASPTAAAASVTVDVAGKVRRPGIAVLPAGSRVVDALEAAGGARAGVDVSALNLARVLVDGEQILVGVEPPPGVAAGVTSAPPVAALVNLNTADQAALESLPEVGPVTAQAILAYRTEHGAFTSVDQLLDVDGIGEATLAKLTPFVTL